MKLIKLIFLIFLPLIFLISCTQENVIQAKVGESFTITLESNATTGFSWQLAEGLDETRLKLESSKYIPAATDRVGSGGEEKWIFRALKKGSAKISLKYVRPWEKDTAPALEKTFFVKVR